MVMIYKISDLLFNLTIFEIGGCLTMLPRLSLNSWSQVILLLSLSKYPGL